MGATKTIAKIACQRDVGAAKAPHSDGFKLGLNYSSYRGCQTFRPNRRTKMTKEPTPMILLIRSLFEANPSIKAIRKVASLGALEIITQNNGIEGIQLIRDDIGVVQERRHIAEQGS